MLFLNLRSGNGRLSHLAVTPGEAMEIHMKFTRPGLLITALLMTSPAFAQYGSPGTTLAPSVTKDDSWDVTQRVKKHVANHKHKKHMASHKQRHQATNSKAQTTGSANQSPLTPSTNKSDTTPKSQ
jgi:hypothetical protein